MPGRSVTPVSIGGGHEGPGGGNPTLLTGPSLITKRPVSRIV